MSVKPAIENYDKKSGFGFLIEKFEALKLAPPLEDICGWLAEAEISPEEIMPFRQFSPEKYTRSLVYRNEFIELLVLGWSPGQESMIHDHDGSLGVIRVAEGAVTETKFDWDEDGKLAVEKKEEVTAGSVAGVGKPDIHQLANASAAETAVTIHVYAPPLEGLNVYDVGSRQIRFYLLD